MLVAVLWHCMWGGAEREQWCLLHSLPAFSHFPRYPQVKWALLVLIPGGWFVYILGPCGSYQRTLLWGWEFLPMLPQPPQVFSIWGLRLYFPTLEPWIAWSVSLSSSSSRFIAYSTSCCLAGQMQPCLPRTTLHHLTESAIRHLAMSPVHLAACLCPSYLSGWLCLL